MLYALIFILIIASFLIFINHHKGGGGVDKEVKRNYDLYHKIEKINFEPLYSRTLLPDAKNEQFFRVHSREILILKLGQRKLFFNELELYSFFLERSALKKGVVVVYAGSAPGIHSTLLAELFPDWQFHYYDMNPFFEKLRDYKNIHLYHQYFTNEDALSFLPNGKKENKEENKKYVIFLSDIRSGEDEDSVERDMIMQRKWVELMKPDLFSFFCRAKKREYVKISFKMGARRFYRIF